MKKLLVLLFATSGLWADTIVSGSSTYDAGIFPFNSNTSFDLVLSGGQFSSIDLTHIYQAGAKGGSNQDYTSSFTFAPVPYYAVGTIGVATDFVVVIDGVSYSQGLTSVPGSVTPPDGSTFSVTLSLTPISGTNVLNTTQNSTASALFAISGSITAFIENGTYFFPLSGGTSYTDTFSGYAAFNGSYMTNGLPLTPLPQLMENYTYSSTLAPEPGTTFAVASVLGCLGLIKALRRKRVLT